jgi:hypothetical protein
VFTACHPVLSTEARIALTLRLLGGLTTDEIARAFLVPEPTIAQRIVRAKRTLSAKNVPFEVPHGDELAARLSSVLAVVYLIFNEGYSATAGDDWMRAKRRKSMASLPSWRSKRRDSTPATAPRESQCCCSIRTARAGITCSFAAVLPRSRGRKRWAAPPSACQVLTRCRRLSRPVMLVRQVLRKQIGHVSLDYMGRLPRSPRRRSSTSIAQLRLQCCLARRLASKLSMR